MMLLVIPPTERLLAETRSASVVIHNELAGDPSELSYERAKLAFDGLIDPSLNADFVAQTLNRLASDAELGTPRNDDIAKLKAVQRVIYTAGDGNSGWPFEYDQSDPYGRDLRNKLIASYIRTRRGNCVSMPILQLIVAERLGLNVSLSTAPLHLFMRYTNPNNGRSIAIESTSGGHPVRESEYFEKMGVTQEQVDSGIYLGALTKRETIAVMATTVVEWLLSEKRYEEAIEVSDVILEYYPKHVHVVLARGSAYGELLRAEFEERYPNPASIPTALQPRYLQLTMENAAAFQQAEEWGWTPVAMPQS